MIAIRIKEKDYNDIIKLGKLFTTTSAASHPELEFIQITVWIYDKKACADACDNKTYAAFYFDLEDIITDEKTDRVQFLIKTPVYKVSKGESVEITCDDTLDNSIKLDYPDGRKNRYPIIKYQYPNFPKYLPKGEPTGFMCLNVKLFKKITDFIGSNELFGMFTAKDGIYGCTQTKMVFVYRTRYPENFRFIDMGKSGVMN